VLTSALATPPAVTRPVASAASIEARAAPVMSVRLFIEVPALFAEFDAGRGRRGGVKAPARR
jgi:hypothetical protein